jgi:hypothetical protein
MTVRTRLAGRKQPRLPEDRLRARIVQRCLDQDQPILQLDRDAVVRAAGEEPDAVGDFLRGHALGGVARRVGNGQVERRIDLHAP